MALVAVVVRLLFLCLYSGYQIVIIIWYDMAKGDVVIASNHHVPFRLGMCNVPRVVCALDV